MSSRPIEYAYRFCPFCSRANPSLGSIPFRCEACGFCNFFGPVAAVGALLTDGNDQLLLVQRARDPGKGMLGLPGGFVDRNETVEQALAREVLEETGLKITRFDYLMSYPNSYDYRGTVAPVIDLFYVCEFDADDKIELDPNELDHYEWVRPTLTHLQRMAFHSNRVAIEKWLSK